MRWPFWAVWRVLQGWRLSSHSRQRLWGVCHKRCKKWHLLATNSVQPHYDSVITLALGSRLSGGSCCYMLSPLSSLVKKKWGCTSWPVNTFWVDLKSKLRCWCCVVSSSVSCSDWWINTNNQRKVTPIVASQQRPPCLMWPYIRGGVCNHANRPIAGSSVDTRNHNPEIKNHKWHDFALSWICEVSSILPKSLKSQWLTCWLKWLAYCESYNY